MSVYRVPTKWRLEDLAVGKVIYCPPHQEVDPATRQGTGRLQKFIVTALDEKQAHLQPYRGDRDAEMPPEPRAVCSRCGRVVPVSDTAEAGLLEAGVMVEFYYCADREACERAARER